MIDWIKEYWVTIVTAGMLIAFSIGLWLVKRATNPKVNHKKVGAALRRFAGIRQYAVLEDLHIRLKDESAQFDYAMVTFYGVLLFSVVPQSAQIYGQEQEGDWVIVEGESRKKAPNPIFLGEQSAMVLRKVFSEHKIYNMQVEHFTIFAGSRRKTEVYVTAPEKSCRRQEIQKLLKKGKFEKDNNVDVKKIAAFLQEQNEAAR